MKNLYPKNLYPRHPMKYGRILGLTAFAFALAVTPAKADLYTLTLDHCTGGCGSSPFGTINITQNGANTVHFDIELANGNEFIQGGLPGSTVGFNLTSNVTVSLTNATLPGWSLDNGGAPGSLNFDGFGAFEYSLNCCFSQTGGSHAQPGSIQFDLTGAGLTPAQFQELSTIPPGDTRAFFAVDVLSGQTGNTGPVGTNTPPSAVPEPSSIVLFGSVLAGVLHFVRKRHAVA